MSSTALPCKLVITTQVEPQEWCLRIEGGLIADSIFGRTASVTRCLNPEGPNMREYFTKMRDRRKGRHQSSRGLPAVVVRDDRRYRGRSLPRMQRVQAALHQLLDYKTSSSWHLSGIEGAA